MLHQAWSDGSFFPLSNRSARAVVEQGAIVVWTVEAASWADAMAHYHNWRGWEPYTATGGQREPYTTEEEARAAALNQSAVE